MAAVTASVLLAAPAATAPGQPTSAFAGTVTFGTEDAAFGVVVQADGKIIAAGSSGSDFGLARYNANGSLDRSFGANGKVLTDFDGRSDGANALAIQADGRIIAAGSSRSDFALARYNANGSLDRSFGSGGKVRTDFGRSDDASAVAIYGDGRIVAAGVTGRGGGEPLPYDFALARYNPNGSLDRSFGSGGKVRTDFGGRADFAYGVAIQGDGKIVSAGQSNTAFVGPGDFALARYNANGSLDPSFGAGGKVRTDFGVSYERANGIAVQSDGRLVVATSGDFALVRYSPDGSLDASFGLGGRSLRSGFGASALAIQGDGRIVAAGSSGSDFGLARFNADGSVDRNFGAGGHVRTDFGRQYGIGQAVAIQGDGRIVVAGASAPLRVGPSKFALARYNPNGSLDRSFGSGGKVRTDFARLVSLSVTRSSNGVRVRWRTASEYGTRGFNVYRETQRANRRLVLSKGSATRGASYLFLDRRAPRRQPLTYYLQEVRRDRPVRYGPVAVRR